MRGWVALRGFCPEESPRVQNMYYSQLHWVVVWESLVSRQSFKNIHKYICQLHASLKSLTCKIKMGRLILDPRGVDAHDRVRTQDGIDWAC